MDASSDSQLTQTAESISERMNKGCLCITLDREALDRALASEVNDADFISTFIKSRSHLFANTTVFLSKSAYQQMLRVVGAIEAAGELPGYQNEVLTWAPETSHHDYGPRGVFMGYDFHLTEDGPKLIEINTNAGGAFLNVNLARAQRACCPEIEFAQNRAEPDDFEHAVMRMFEQEWIQQRMKGKPQRIAIVDDGPREQYLYPEFVLAQRFFKKHYIDAMIVDPNELRYKRGGGLEAQNQSIDLVYNRLVDFSLRQTQHQTLRDAYLDNAVVVTPNPHVHALFADKRNLTLLSNPAALRSWGFSHELSTDLLGIPRTVLVTTENAQELWNSRKILFFKPFGGHGGKAVYRGDKVTKGVWTEIVSGGYVAQEIASPSERAVKIDGNAETRKTDIRLYVYNGQVLLTAARLYQGQTTNFRTPGSGFAPVFVI